MENNFLESYKLEKPHKLERDIKEARVNFWKFAKTRVRIHSEEEHIEFHKAHCPKDEMPASGIFVLERGSTEGEDPERGILGLEISINKDFYGEEYADLIPYVIEHEIYEAWLYSKRGLRTTLKHGHLLARMHQIRMAMKDGKAERLVEFYSNKLPTLKDEFNTAYKRVKKEKL